MRVLVCDDDESTRTMIEVALRMRGHDVDLAANADEAIQTFEHRYRAGETYDLILLDVGLPVRSGWAAAGHVRGRGYSGRLAIMTGDEPEPDLLATLRAEYLGKPEVMRHIVEWVEGLPLS